MVQLNVRKRGEAHDSLNERQRDWRCSSSSHIGTTGADHQGPTFNNAHDASQMDEDGTINVYGGQMGDPKHALDQK